MRPAATLIILTAAVLLLQAGVLVWFAHSVTSVPHITGKVTSADGTVGFYFIPQSFCQVPLTQGWTLISLCANGTNTNITTLLAGLNYRYVMRWNQSSQGFDIFSPLAANPPFRTMEFNTSYFVNLNEASGTMHLQGNPVGDLDVGLVPGWNGPGYPYDFNTTITRYFNSTDHRYLMKWNASTQSFLIYSPRAANPAFLKINTGEGQMLNSHASTPLHYNRTALQAP